MSDKSATTTGRSSLLQVNGAVPRHRDQRPWRRSPQRPPHQHPWLGLVADIVASTSDIILQINQQFAQTPAA